MTEFGFKKWERITSPITIDTLFKGGSTEFEFPFKVFYSFGMTTPLKGRIEMAIAVPKKRLKHAHERNYIKRLTREAFRLNKPSLLQTLEQCEKKLSVFFVYVGTADVKPAQLQQKIIVILNRLQSVTVSEDQKESI